MKLVKSILSWLYVVYINYYEFLTIGQLLSDHRSRELLIESILYC